jgi:predicted nucleotidyltransferase component of viral defense system
MPSTAGPHLHSEILTPLQIAFLKQFFTKENSPAFFLTGGTSLAGFYFGHRLSEDLDLFTVTDGVLNDVDTIVPLLAQLLNCQIIQSRRAEHFRQFILQAPQEAEALKIDFVRDFGPQYGEHVLVETINIDALENIGANKVTAILGRTEIKDFVDLHYILRNGFEFEHLFNLAKERDTGLNEFYLAQAMLQVNRLTLLPRMLTPLNIADLQAEFTTLANMLLDKINPQNK